MLTMLSGLSTVSQSSESTYLKCNDTYYGLTSSYLESNDNIRQKNLKLNNKLWGYFSCYNLICV